MGRQEHAALSWWDKCELGLSSFQRRPEGLPWPWVRLSLSSDHVLTTKRGLWPRRSLLRCCQGFRTLPSNQDARGTALWEDWVGETEDDTRYGCGRGLYCATCVTKSEEPAARLDIQEYIPVESIRKVSEQILRRLCKLREASDKLPWQRRSIRHLLAAFSNRNNTW